MVRYAITDRSMLGADEPARQTGLLKQVAVLASQGVEFIQLREKDMPAYALAGLARALVDRLKNLREDRLQDRLKDRREDRLQGRLQGRRENAFGGPQPRLLINSRADVALAVGADGVHLTSAAGELTATQVHTLYGECGLGRPIISISCHTLADVERAVSEDPVYRPDLILFGPVFEKRLGPLSALPGTGIEVLAQACATAAPVPVLALGGVTADKVSSCVSAGAAGVAAIRLFVC